MKKERVKHLPDLTEFRNSLSIASLKRRLDLIEDYLQWESAHEWQDFNYYKNLYRTKDEEET